MSTGPAPPYALALATIRLAMDVALDEPDTAHESMRDADAADPSAYIRDFARAAHGEQELIFGDLRVVIESGHQVITSASRPIQQFGYWFLVHGGLLGRDSRAVDEALTAAQRFATRQIPGSQQLVDTAEYIRSPPATHQ